MQAKCQLTGLQARASALYPEPHEFSTHPGPVYDAQERVENICFSNNMQAGSEH
jgi:hypothetical protein